jgi:hypothetical protein
MQTRPHIVTSNMRSLISLCLRHWMTNMTTISEFEFDRPTSAAQAVERAASILRSVGVDPHQIGIWLLRQHGKFDATHFNVYEDACELVEWLTTQPKRPQEFVETALLATVDMLTATQIGKMLAQQSTDITHPPSAQQINQALEQLNFHSRDDKKVWQLTKLGQQYGRLISLTDEQDRTRLQVRWLPTVLDRLAPLFVSC